MSFNEEKSPPKDNAKPAPEEKKENPDLQECIKQKVSEGMTEEEAKGYCEKQDEEKPAPEEETPDQQNPPSEEQQPVQEITPEQEQKDPNAPPQQDPNAPLNTPPDQGQGFGQYQNFEQCLQDQLSQGINQKDSVVNCAAQLLVHMQNQGQAAPMNGPGGSNPPMAASYNIGGVEFKISEFPDFETCVHAFKDKGMGKEESIDKCNSIFNAKFDKTAIATQQIQVQKAKEGSDKLYVRAFLLDSSLNKNFWGVDGMSIDQRISSFVGRPLVLTEDFGHPELSDMNLGHALQYQDIYRIGTIIDVVQTAKSEHDKNKKVYYAIIEITDEKAKAAFRDNDLPLYVSPAVAKLNASESDGNISEWLGMHLAVVDKPAFGVAKAQITGSCSGEEQKCVMHLRQAKIDKDGYGNCGFCVYAKLTSVLKTANVMSKTAKEESKFQVGESNTKPELITVSPDASGANEMSETSNSSLTSENTQKQLTMSNTEQSIESKVAEAKEEIKKAELEKQGKSTNTNENVDKFPDKSTSDYAGFDIVQAKLVRYQTENTLLKAKLEEVNASYQELDQKYKDLQNESRRAQISSIVTAELYPDATQRQKMIDFFIEKNLPPQMVAEMYASLGNNISSKTAKTYDSKVPVVKTAKTSNDLESTSLAKEARKMFIKGGNKA